MSDTDQELRELLAKIAGGERTPTDALERVKALALRSGLAPLGHSLLDLGRARRSGMEEVVFAGGKSIPHLLEIVRTFLTEAGHVLVTKISGEQSAALQRDLPELIFEPEASAAWLRPARIEPAIGSVAIVSGGTSDSGIAAEADVCARYFGLESKRINDCGVAGLSRLLSVLDELNECDFVIVVAGMEAALPTLVASLTTRPIIAVPTSAGYGVGAAGIPALLSMLVSCSPGISVVNIDNGFGAAAAATKTIRALKGTRESS